MKITVDEFGGIIRSHINDFCVFINEELEDNPDDYNKYASFKEWLLVLEEYVYDASR